ncbi:hypothetical protein K9N50_13060 [bacterium]|nr:hypothetical protein [bacterium]
MFKTPFFIFILSIPLLIGIHSNAIATQTNHSFPISHIAAETDRSAVFRDLENYQVTFEYVNDNFIATTNFEPILNFGKDDNVTASFLLQIALETEARWLMLNIYQTIITNKQEGYRTDLLSVYPSIEQKFGNGQLTLGAGLIARGNYGGEFIQSTYHRIVHLDPVELPYIGGNRFGFILLTGYEYRLNEGEYSILGCFLRNSLKVGSGPSSLRTGVKLDLLNRNLIHNCILQLQVNTGYLFTYVSDRYISPIFDSGNYQALLGSIGFMEKFQIAGWISLNQYGLHQTHFGATLTFGWNGSRISDLRELLYP